MKTRTVYTFKTEDGEDHALFSSETLAYEAMKKYAKAVDCEWWLEDGLCCVIERFLIEED